jgi:hypothetical protein
MRQRAFPRTMLQKVSSQRLAARDQTVLGVWQGENGKEREGCLAPRAQAAANPNPVVTLVMSLFAPSAMADDRIARTLRTEANDPTTSTSRRPVKVWVAIVPRKWDKQNRIAWRLSHGAEPCQDKRPQESLLPPFPAKSQPRKNNPILIFLLIGLHGLAGQTLRTPATRSIRYKAIWTKSLARRTLSRARGRLFSWLRDSRFER